MRSLSRIVYSVATVFSGIIVLFGIVAPIFGGILSFLWGALAIFIGIVSCVFLVTAYKHTYLTYPRNEHKMVWSSVFIMVAFLGTFDLVFISAITAFLFFILLLFCAYLVAKPTFSL